MRLLALCKNIFSEGEACIIAKGELDSAFPQFDISLYVEWWILFVKLKLWS